MFSFREELQTIMADSIGTIVLGELNILHKRWLRFSNDKTAQGEIMQEIANDSRKRRSNSAGPRRNNSKGPRNQRVSVATPEGGAAAMDSLRMKEIEAQIKAEEQALKGSS